VLKSEKKTCFINWVISPGTNKTATHEVLFAVRRIFLAEPAAKMEPEENVGIKARSVLWYLTFVGFAMNYMIR
jgi:hypothetical protein